MMAKAVAGEVSLDTPGGKVTLRLDIGTMMDLEDLFDMGAVHLIGQIKKMKLRELSRLYLAMTGGRFAVPEEVDRVAKDVVLKIGVVKVAVALADCLTKTFMADKPGKPDGAAQSQ